MARILLVGNDPAEREVRALVIEFGGHRCRMAGSLREALNLLRQESFDLVVTDFKPNGSSSEQVAKSLKAACPEVAVMVLTESGDTTAEEADEVVAIPCPPENLLQRIEQVLSRSADPAVRRPDHIVINALRVKSC